jgi:dolichol kinase
MVGPRHSRNDRSQMFKHRELKFNLPETKKIPRTWSELLKILFLLDGPVVIVRVEEVLLVVLVLMIWVAAIALFFNRWGKIRMLEPYQPKFHQQPHRPSCPLAPLSPPGIAPQVSNTLPRAQKPTTVRSSHA